jgi:hypothetical protein
MASTKSKVDYWFFYNENGVKRRGHLPKTKKKSGGCSTLVKKVK